MKGTLSQQKNDWVLYAWLIRTKGPMSLESISQYVQLWRRRDPGKHRIARLMTMHKSKGFVVIETGHYGKSYYSIYDFEGTLPEISKGTELRWSKKINLFIPYGNEHQ